MRRNPPGGGGPLAGIRVIDVATVLAGPLAGQILGDYGADVIKVEHPRHGDAMRHHGQAKGGESLWWKMIGRNKRSVGLYLGDPDGAELFRQLVASADVVIENFRPGTLERYGLGWPELSRVNPGLVLARVTGFGQDGPYAHRPAFGTLMESMSGFAHITGQPDGPPTLPPFGLADSIAGITTVAAVTMALYHRDARGGMGQVIDLSILEPIVTVLGPQPIIYDQLGVVQHRTGNRSGNNAPRNTYRTRDGKWVAISTSAQAIAERVMTLVGHPEVISEPWFRSGRERAKHADLLDRYVGDWIAQRDCAEVVAEFEAAGAAVAPVYDARDLVNDPHIQATEMLTRVADDDLGPMLMHNVMWRMSSTPGRIRFTGRDLGADTDDILINQLGYEPSQLAELRERKIVA